MAGRRLGNSRSGAGGCDSAASVASTASCCTVFWLSMRCATLVSWKKRSYWST
jgi:hypothetical protein